MAEKVMRIVFVFCAVAAAAAVIAICVFILWAGIPGLKAVGISEFLGGERWRPLEGAFGVFPMIVGSVYVTGGALVLAVPTGVLCAMFLANLCPPKLHIVLKGAVELMAGIPSIVYGLFGVSVVVPAVRLMAAGCGVYSSGRGILTAAAILAMMILPTIVSVCEDALRAVPRELVEGARALGEEREQSWARLQVRGARRGILTGIAMGTGRAMGETMAVVMVAGNQPVLPDSVMSGVRTLTANIALEMSYAAEGLHRDALMATALVLLCFTLLVNGFFGLLRGGE